ncbi:glycoside hydrolase family 79 protein, partial [Laetiporus sulphureus 93-53]
MYTAAAAYDPTVLNPPPIPDPPPSTQFELQLHNDAGDVQGLSFPMSGALLGFCIEMSVADQVRDTHLQVPFLNLMALITECAGRVHVRVGGNFQENATLISDLSNGKSIAKQSVDGGNPIHGYTGPFIYPEILYMLSNISGLVNTKWYLGMPLNDSSNLHLAIAEYGERILGDNLIGLQIGNELDLYARHGHRPATYSPYDYFGEFGQVIQAMQADANTPVTNNLLSPSIATGDWTPEGMAAAVRVFSPLQRLIRACQIYPNDNCAALYPGFGPPQDSQSVFPSYLTHASCKSIIAPYLNSSAIALAAGKPFIMFEMNTASCGGFPRISDSFGAALWVVDYVLQMGASDFSHTLLHVGGQDVYYNPFTPPLTNQSKIHQWTIGPIFYSVLAVAE